MCKPRTQPRKKRKKRRKKRLGLWLEGQDEDKELRAQKVSTAHLDGMIISHVQSELT